MAKYKRRQTAWKVIAAAMILLGVGIVLGVTFDTELFPILMKGIIGCALAFAGMFMIQNPPADKTASAALRQRCHGKG